MIAISVNDLSLSFGTTVILDKVSFSLEERKNLTFQVNNRRI